MIRKIHQPAAQLITIFGLGLATPAAFAGETNDCHLEGAAGETLVVHLSTDAQPTTAQTEHLRFNVSQKRAGDYVAQTAIISIGVPDEEIVGDWKTMSITLDAPLCLPLTDFQAIGIVYTKPGGEVHYNHYLDETASTLASVGGSIATRLENPDFESNIQDAMAPYKVSLVNWESADGPDQYLASEGFQAATPIFNEGVEVIEWFDLRLIED